MNIDELLKAAIEKGSSDLHLKVGVYPMVRINGGLAPLDKFPKVNQEESVALAFSVMNPSQKEKFKERFELDLAYSAAGLGRFRVNVFKQRGTIGMVFRVIPVKVSSIRELLLPPVVEKLSLEHRGMVLVTGTTGSGKSTTLASMVDFINQNRTVNIITIEDPIEFLHRDKKGIVSQREIGQDTESFSLALRSALRQDPDVILVGEMRDFETISTALVAAETGHLVLSTLHTLDAVETVNRIIAVFPPYQQKQVRMQLASVIRGIVSMRLAARADGKGRVPAAEIMVGTQTVREAIVDPEKTRHIHDIIAAGSSQYGMQTFDQSLHDLFKKQLVSYEEALKWTSNPEDFALKVKGIQSTSESWEEAQVKDEGGGKLHVDRF
ncbi:MAG TPA: type IV pilus twitching motility protein PilT [Candidatus Manganitrophaceae bacterium]|nr:type IV pilus twitching motility protein PilT [Candidatus Manganitrophaceae bacterium]